MRYLGNRSEYYHEIYSIDRELNDWHDATNGLHNLVVKLYAVAAQDIANLLLGHFNLSHPVYSTKQLLTGYNC